jgi:RNA polymerase sigma factor (sigma-70 family)
MTGDSTDQDVLVPAADVPPARWAQIWGSRALLLRIARRHGANAEDAEDAVQEAMLRAAEHPEISDERLQAWLVAVTMRLCMDGYRRRANEARRWQRASAQAVVQQPGQHLEEEVCERSEAVWVASLAAEVLPPRQAQALHLAAAGCDVQQVASQLGVRYRAAESLLARARRTVKTAVTTSLGLLVWAWRTHLPAVSNPAPMALASATAATMMAVTLPPVLPIQEQMGGLPRPPSAVTPSAPVPAPAGHLTLPPPPAPPPVSTPRRDPHRPPLPTASDAAPPASRGHSGALPLHRLPASAKGKSPTTPAPGRSDSRSPRHQPEQAGAHPGAQQHHPQKGRCCRGPETPEPRRQDPDRPRVGDPQER